MIIYATDDGKAKITLRGTQFRKWGTVHRRKKLKSKELWILHQKLMYFKKLQRRYMVSLLTYNDVLTKIDEKKVTLLLGNGFSMAYDSRRFSFTHLLEKAISEGLINEESSLYKVFCEFSLSDFEEVIRMLENSAKIDLHYGIKDVEKLKQDAKNLKKYLVKIITNNHPEKISDISDDEYINCAKFISRYSEIYTLNYDLLLYWTTMKLDAFRRYPKLYSTISAKDFGSLNINDGFGNDEDDEDVNYVVYKTERPHGQKIHYLHGALHIFDKGNKIIKNTYSRTGEMLKSQTYRNLLKDVYPIFISEGTSEMKKRRILHNALLTHEYKSLTGKGGDLVIFGTVLKTNDEHIRKAILDGNGTKGFKHIYMGVFSENDKREAEAFKLEAEHNGRKCFLYDASSVHVWR